MVRLAHQEHLRLLEARLQMAECLELSAMRLTHTAVREVLAVQAVVLAVLEVHLLRLVLPVVLMAQTEQARKMTAQKEWVVRDRVYLLLLLVAVAVVDQDIGLTTIMQEQQEDRLPLF
jgi:hypothetical protein